MINKKNSNRGGALLSVVIVMAIAGILGALAISIAYTNFTMKVVDKKSKDNFYSAEKVLEEICVGLQEVASEQYKIAYTEVMSLYNPDKSGLSMETEFKNLFVVNMVSELQEEGNSREYNIGERAVRDENGVVITPAKGLYGFVKNNYGATVTYTITSSIKEDNTLENKIDTLTDGLALRNVKVTYQDGGYYNEITTDIKISVPAVQFSKVSAMPEIAEFSFIAEGGVDVEGSSGITLTGKAYSGIIVPDLVSADGTKPIVSIRLGSGSNFDATNTKSVLLVSKGEILLEGDAGFYTGDKTALWAESISTAPLSKLENEQAINTISLNGRAYINDDTTLNAYGDNLILAGQYYGFSNHDTFADETSSIIVNGKNSSIDMSALDTLVLAGTSFVGTQGTIDSQGNGQQADKDILMGDSVAVKSNQVAYLVPTECPNIVCNPMTFAQYEELPTGWQSKALNEPLSMLRNRNLASYGDVEIVPVFKHNVGDGGTVYLYLNFKNSEKASEYFMDYYRLNKNIIDGYLNTYLQGFEFDSVTNGSTRIVTQGNYLIPGTGENVAQYIEATGDAALNVQELTNYESSFFALCKKLITNDSALTESERNGTVYSNLVNETDIKGIEEFFDDIEVVLDSGETTSDGSVKYIIDTNNDIKEAIFNGEEKVYIVDNNNNQEKSSSYTVKGNTGVVIATGDVNVKNDNWKGLIICGGKLNIIGDTKILTHDPKIVGKSMQMGCEFSIPTVGENGNTTNVKKEYKVLNFFKSGSEYTSGTFGENAEMTDVRNCISYENYKSE